METLARLENRSLSYIVEEALVKFIEKQGQKVPHAKRTDHRSPHTQ